MKIPTFIPPKTGTRIIFSPQCFYQRLILFFILRHQCSWKIETTNHRFSIDATIPTIIEPYREQTRISRTTLFSPSFTAFGKHRQPLLRDNFFQFRFPVGSFIPTRRDMTTCLHIILRFVSIHKVDGQPVIIQIFGNIKKTVLIERSTHSTLIARAGIFSRPPALCRFRTKKPHLGCSHQNGICLLIDCQFGQSTITSM